MCVHFSWIKNFYFLKIDAECFHWVWEREELTFISTHLMLGSVTGIVWTLSCSVSYQEPKWGDGRTISSWWQPWDVTHCLDSLESSFAVIQVINNHMGLEPRFLVLRPVFLPQHTETLMTFLFRSCFSSFCLLSFFFNSAVISVLWKWVVWNHPSTI